MFLFLTILLVLDILLFIGILFAFKKLDFINNKDFRIFEFLILFLSLLVTLTGSFTVSSLIILLGGGT